MLNLVVGLGLERNGRPPLQPRHFTTASSPAITSVKLPCSRRLAWPTAATRSTLETHPTACGTTCVRDRGDGPANDGQWFLPVSDLDGIVLEESACFENARLRI